MKILIVDDDAAVARILARILRDHDVVIEDDPRAAISRAERGESFDAVFSDFHMVPCSGTVVLGAFRAPPQAFVPLLVLMTGDYEVEVGVADVVLQKPFSAGEVRGVATRAADRRNGRAHAVTARLRTTVVGFA